MIVPAWPAMHIGALGDIHGAFETVQTIMTRHADVPLWVQVGDVATNDGEYFTLESAKLYTRPEQPVPIYIATAGPVNAKKK